MKRIGLKFVLAWLIALPLTSGMLVPEMRAETQGTFRGEVIAAPRGELNSGLLYLKGRDGNVRRVVVARAAVVYDATVPSADRKKSAQAALVPGTEVRVTALVDAESGEWTASRIEVMTQHHSADFEEDYGESGNAPDEVNSERSTLADKRTI